jgi:hypothetical protein
MINPNFKKFIGGGEEIAGGPTAAIVVTALTSIRPLWQ